MLYLLFVLFSFFVHSHAVSFVCNGTNSITPPANLSDVILYPSSWNQSLPVQEYALNQECRWDIQVPQGYWAYLTVYASTPSPSTLNVIYANGKEENLYETVSNSPFAFIAPKFSIILKANSNKTGTLGFRIAYISIPEFKPDSHLLSATDPEIITDLSACVITAPVSQVSLVASKSSLTEFIYFLRFFVVYDGPDTNSTYLGNLYDALAKGKQMVSSGKQLTVVNLFPELTNLGNYIMVQDYSNVKQFVNYRFDYCITPNCNLYLDATNGSAAVVSLSKSNIYIQTVEIPKTASVSVYYGSIKNSNIVHVYKSNSTIFPQRVNNYVSTFVLDSGIGMIGITSLNMIGNWMNSIDGRTGYITSPQYGILSSNQSIIERFTGVDYYNYTIQFVNHGLVGNAQLQVTTYDKSENIIDDHHYTKDNIPPTIKNYPGKSLSVIYQSNGEMTTGVLLNFSIVMASGASVCMLWTAAIVLLLFS